MEKAQVVAPVASGQEAPSQRSFAHRWFTFPAAICFLLFLVVFFHGTTGKITEPDFWWHLRNADHLLTTHSFPNFDQYSFTAAGARWIDHEWLSELCYYAAFQSSGLRGVFGLFSVLSAAIFAGLYYRCRMEGANPKTASIVILLGILAASVSFGPRALLFGWLALTILLIVLERFASTRSAPLWIIPPLFCLWINLHGSWIFGVAVLGAFIVSGMLQGEWGAVSAVRFSAGELKRLFAVAGAAVAALFLNPFGYRLVAYPFDLMFRQQTNLNHIDEWQSVDFHELRGKIALLMLLAIMASMVASRRRWKLHEVLLGAFALYASLTYWRMQFFAAIIFVPLIATRLRLFPDYDPRKEKPLLNAAIILGVMGMILAQFPSEAKLHAQIQQNYPEAALAFMRERHISDRVFDEYTWGGYMIWHAPEIKTFIDGRADLFVYSGVFDDYVQIIRLNGTLDLLNRYRIRHALLGRNTPLAYLLGHTACWQEIYSDKIAAVYERNLAVAGCGAEP